MLSLLLATAAALTIEDYATMPVLSAPRWSPDGKQIAYVVTSADLARNVYEGDVWLITADGGAGRRLTQQGNDTAPRWSPGGTSIAFLSDRGGPAQVYVIDVGGGEARRVTNEPGAVRVFEWSRDGKAIAFIRADETKAQDGVRVAGEGTRHVHLHVVDVASGETRRLTQGAFSIFSLSWLGDEIVIDRGPGTGLDELYRSDIYAVSSKDGAMRELVVRPGLDRGPSVSPDGKWIAFTSTGAASAGDARDWLREHPLHVVPAEGGAPRELASASYGRTPESIRWSDDSRTIFFEGPWNTTAQLYRVNVDGSGFADTTKYAGFIGDPDVRGARAAFICQSLTEPPEVCVDAQRITNHNDALRGRELGATQVIRWKNPNDGLELEGLLTLPAGWKKGDRVPLITFVHGGPASQFSQSFLGYLGSTFAPVHVFAARGFAVLRPNPRGSGGYGNALRRGPLNDWAGMPWLDVESGIDKLVADGIADPDRLGLMGWSYGGYLAAWAAARSDRFDAISIGAGIADLLSHHLTSDIRDYIPAYYPGLPLDLLRAHSPIWQMKKSRAKILIVHGENDERVPPSQGTMLYHRLRELGTDVSMVVMPRSAHGSREPRLRIDVLRRNVELFEAKLGH